MNARAWRVVISGFVVSALGSAAGVVIVVARLNGWTG